jgi:GNAT superfamily N-acetyltransferase
MAASELLLATRSALDPARMQDVEALVREAGWNQVAADWRIFLELGHVHAAHDGSGRIVATAATLPYGRFGWISMVLVAGEYRRQGLATRLMHRCIEELTSAGCVPLLDATPAGREVYRALGFEDTWSFHRLALNERRRPAESPSHAAEPAPNASDTVIRAIDDGMWPAICAYDAAAFGADRGALLAHLRRRLPPAALCAMRGGRIVGFLLGRDGRTTSQLGPLIAEDDVAAQALLARALALVGGPLYVDLADAKAATAAWLAARGFQPQRPLTRMVYRRHEGFDDSARTYTVLGPEFG